MLNKFVYSPIYINYSRHGCRQLSWGTGGTLNSTKDFCYF